MNIGSILQSTQNTYRIGPILRTWGLDISVYIAIGVNSITISTQHMKLASFPILCAVRII